MSFSAIFIRYQSVLRTMAVDGDNTFEGKLSFRGDDWNWNAWVYDIKLKDGSQLKVSGRMDEEGIKTQKTLLKVDGAAFLMFKENLQFIDTHEYDVRRKQIVGDRI